MTNEEWAASDDALKMLKALYDLDPTLFKKTGNALHRYLIACCWKIEDLIPQQVLQDGLKGTVNWIEGRITDEEFRHLEWCAEAEAFMLDYAKTPEDFDEIRKMIAGTEQLQSMPLDAARKKLMDAAYFTDRTMVHPTTKSSPYNNRFFASEFQCPDLLREYIKPDFGTRH
ncbi:MAG: hypothetical protein AAGH90_13345 [Pseudomonadota bacterium]